MSKSIRKLKGRGTENSVDGRYLEYKRSIFDDEWGKEADDKRIATEVTKENARTIISRNSSPDIPFDLSINPYRGCEHGCNYCYARPTHAYLDLSPGIDFETKLFAKTNAAELLIKELAKKTYSCMPIALGTNTDPYQPIEREFKITRSIIEVFKKYKQPCTIVTKSHLILRDLELLAEMAKSNLLQVFISVTTLNPALARTLEPRASAPFRRVDTIQTLSDAGIPVGLMFAPVIPFVNDMEMEDIISLSAAAGAKTAGYVMLRLPHEVKDLFREWLDLHLPLKKEHVMSIITDMRAGKDYDSSFHTRMRGDSVYAKMIRKRFEHCCKKEGLDLERYKLSCDLFQAPQLSGTQQNLF